MKRTPLKQQGKIGRRNASANKKLKQMYLREGILNCELRLEGCQVSSFLGFAHRYKRIEYRRHPEALATFNQTVLACVNCHQKIEYDRELTERVFEQLRGDDELIYLN